MDNTFLKFGTGALLVDTGTYGGSPAVFIKAAAVAGPVGEKAPESEQVPLDALVDDEIVLTFPTIEQAKSVADALVTPPQEAA